MTDASDPPLTETGALLVLVSCPPEVAESLARTVVEQGFAACVQILNSVRSIYRWKDAVECGQETLLLIKTTTQAYPGLEHQLRELHPYELPEIVSMPLSGLPEYLAWVRKCVA